MLIPEPTAVTAADMMAIQQLAVGYAEAISRGDIDEAVQVYAPDGVLASPTTEDAVGHSAIAAVLRRTIGNLELVFQTVHLGLVHVDGDRAAARFPITEWARGRGDQRPCSSSDSTRTMRCGSPRDGDSAVGCWCRELWAGRTGCLAGSSHTTGCGRRARSARLSCYRLQPAPRDTRTASVVTFIAASVATMALEDQSGDHFGDRGGLFGTF
ncbi:nuclear transport factor 2 family protein [Mycobacterium colombiense]